MMRYGIIMRGIPLMGNPPARTSREEFFEVTFINSDRDPPDVRIHGRFSLRVNRRLRRLDLNLSLKSR